MEKLCFPSHLELFAGALLIGFAVYGFSINAACLAVGIWLITPSH